MADSIIDIESGLERIETLVKALREDRDKARAETEVLKKNLDDRELELLQLDEELQNTVKSKAELENRLTEVASRVKNLLPLISDYPGEISASANLVSPDDRT
jgi:chromosome segregation ATPase